MPPLLQSKNCHWTPTSNNFSLCFYYYCFSTQNQRWPYQVIISLTFFFFLFLFNCCLFYSKYIFHRNVIYTSIMTSNTCTKYIYSFCFFVFIIKNKNLDPTHVLVGHLNWIGLLWWVGDGFKCMATKF